MKVLLSLAFVFLVLSQVRAQDNKIVCYWSPDNADVNPSPTLCTHIIISFFEITANGDVQFFDQYGESLIRNAIQKAKGWRSSNPNLKILMAIGGAKGPNLPFAWNSVSSNQQKRSDFAMNIARRIEEFQLDGVDIDWEYPNNSPGEPNKEKPEEKGYFTSLLRDIKQRIGSSKILTTAIGAGSWRGEASYEVANIFSICDFVNIMTYDMHGTWRDTTGLHNALQMTNNSEVTVKDSINYLLGKSIDKKKIIVGIATYGKIFYLKSGSNYIGAPMFNGNDIEGKKDAFSNFEMCSKLRSNELTSVYAGNQMVPYAFNQSVWVSYENVISVTEKANYIKNNGFGGAMFWSLSQDDFNQTCGGDRFPLISAVSKILRGNAQFSCPALNGWYAKPGDPECRQAIFCYNSAIFYEASCYPDMRFKDGYCHPAWNVQCNP